MVAPILNHGTMLYAAAVGSWTDVDGARVIDEGRGIRCRRGGSS